MSDVTVESIDEQILVARDMVPHHLWTGIRNHILFGGDTGNFLTGMFGNDLLRAACGADEVSLTRLRDLMVFLHNYAPSYAWGTPEAVVLWRRHGGIKGRAHEHPEVIAAYERRAS